MQPTQQQQPPAYQQQPMVVQPQPQVTVHEGPNGMISSQSSRGGKWCWKGLRITGYLQVIMGVLAVLFGIISIIVKTYLFFVATPIWCGILFFIITGVLGIAAGGKQRSGLVIGYMIMSIISSVAAVSLMGFAGGVISSDSFLCPEYWFYQYHTGYQTYRCSTSSGARIGIDVCILLIGLAEFVIAVVGASFTCVSLHVNSSSSPRNTVSYQAYRQHMVVGVPPQGVYYPPGANVAYPNQFVMQPQPQYVVQPQTQYVVQPQTQYAVQPTQIYQAQPQGQIQPPPQGQFQPPPQGQLQPTPQGQFQPPPQAQVQPPPQEEQKQSQPPPQGQLQPLPQGQSSPQAMEQIHPETPLSNEENLKQPLTI